MIVIWPKAKKEHIQKIRQRVERYRYVNINIDLLDGWKEFYMDGFRKQEELIRASIFYSETKIAQTSSNSKGLSLDKASQKEEKDEFFRKAIGLLGRFLNRCEKTIFFLAFFSSL